MFHELTRAPRQNREPGRDRAGCYLRSETRVRWGSQVGLLMTEMLHSSCLHVDKHIQN